MSPEVAHCGSDVIGHVALASELTVPADVSEERDME